MTPYEIKLRYEKVDKDGRDKKVSELYVLDAQSFTEAEAKITDQMLPYISGDYEIKNIRKANYAEVHISGNGAFYYRVKIAMLTMTDSGKIKTTAMFMLIDADDVSHAYSKAEMLMKGTVSDWKIVSVSETNIIEVFV